MIGPAYFDCVSANLHPWWSPKLNRDLFDALQRDLAEMCDMKAEDLDFLEDLCGESGKKEEGKKGKKAKGGT